jgi:hypothetical protein
LDQDSRKSFISEQWPLNLVEQAFLLLGNKNTTVYYDGIDIGTRRADFVVENRVSVELKALARLEAANPRPKLKITQWPMISLTRAVVQFWRNKFAIQTFI